MLHIKNGKIIDLHIFIENHVCMNYTCGYCQKYIKPGELIQTVFERKVSYSR